MTATPSTQTRPAPAARRRRFRPVVGRRLKVVLSALFAIFAVLGVNSVYLASVTFAEWVSWRWGDGHVYQNYFYQWMFLLHLVLGLALTAPLVVFGVVHIRNAWNRPNRRAVLMGCLLFAAALLALATGLVLTRFSIGAFEFNLVRDGSAAKAAVYWSHVLLPAACVWLYVLHRLAGRRIKWRVGAVWGAVAAAAAALALAAHTQNPQQWGVEGPAAGEAYFEPSLARTASGGFIPERALMMDQYCMRCHPDAHHGWAHSAHRFASFNNPAYLFSIRNTRAKVFQRDGDVHASRFCAGCHDPVPFFSGAFEDPRFDDPDYDLSADPLANAGISCTACHAITNINSPKGNAAFTIEEPQHYPFAYADNPFLMWVNEQLVKAKPSFHKHTFLKPLHQTPEFCGACHKVHLPEELNDYRWLRGQNHYDAFLLSGVSGHGVSSFYYPPQAETDCNGCHMPLRPSDDFGARDVAGDGRRVIHDHQFPSANTAIPHLLDMPEWVNEAHRDFNQGVMRIDIFALRPGGRTDADIVAPIRPSLPHVEPGRRCLLDVVVRTLKMGHSITQGTADSKQVCLDVAVRAGDRVIGRSGAMDPADNAVDPWAHFINAFVLDRDGHRIDRRNAEDIFTTLYNNQIPPGAADAVHYAVTIPPDVTVPVTIEVALRYRKFDTNYLRLFQGGAFDGNDLPVMTLAEDAVTLPVRLPTGELIGPVDAEPADDHPLWQRWNDYGIGLLRKGDEGSNRGELRQAAFAFAQVEALGRPDGPLNLARVMIKEGRLDEAVDALARAEAFEPPANPWTLEWFKGLVNKRNGNLDDAIGNFRAILAMRNTEECRQRGFDFTKDYRLLNELGQTLFDRAKLERGDAGAQRRDALAREAAGVFQRTLVIDPENAVAHYALSVIHRALGEDEAADRHARLHDTYKVDENARDLAVAAARARYPAADHAANAVVIYDLQRTDAHAAVPAGRPTSHDQDTDDAGD